MSTSYGSAKTHSSSSSSSQSPIGNMGMYSPRTAEIINTKYQQPEDNKPKMTLMKKPQGIVE